jgi:hypothetical protein
MEEKKAQTRGSWMSKLYDLGEKVPETGISSIASDAYRQFNRAGTKAIGSAIGAIPGLASFGLNAVDYGINKLTGVESGLGKVAEYLPTPQKVTDYIRNSIIEREGRPEGYFEQHNNWEKYLDDTVDTLTGLLVGIPGTRLGGVGLKTAAGLTAAKEGSKFAAEKLGAGELGQELAGFGGMLISSIIGAPRTLQKSSELYESAQKSAKEHMPYKSDLIRKAIKETEKTISKLPRSNNDIKSVYETLESIASGIDYDKNVDLNTLLKQKQFMNKSLSDVARGYLTPVREAIRQTIGEARNVYPEFSDNFLRADKLHSAARAAEETGLFIGKNIDISKVKDPFITGLFTLGASALASPFLPGPLSYGLGVLGYSYIGKSVAEAINVLYSSPEAQKYYLEVVNGALKRSAPAVIRGLNRLDSTIKREKKRATSSGLIDLGPK